jgi:hypothetical protein
MNIPHYWTRLIATDQDPVPGMVVYGWSETSVDDARMVARERMQKFAAMLQRGDGPWGEYPYPKKPLREEIVQEWSTGGANNVVTRNGYGSLVLNTDRVVIIDVDLPRLGFFESIKRLFTGGGGSEEQALFDKLQAATDKIGCAMRLYRTRAGYRGIVTDRVGEPGDAFTEQLFAGTGTDPQYARLCGVQKSYRARLTPKHWRLGVPKPPNKFLREEPDAAAKFAAWLGRYEEACRGFSTCTLLETFGSDTTIYDVAHAVEMHDEATGAKLGQELA